MTEPIEKINQYMQQPQIPSGQSFLEILQQIQIVQWNINVHNKLQSYHYNYILTPDFPK